LYEIFLARWVPEHEIQLLAIESMDFLPILTPRVVRFVRKMFF